jgi:hypothetical protein
MLRKPLKVTRTLALLAVSLPAIAQYVTTPQPSQAPAGPPSTSTPTRAEDVTITPKNGQSEEQKWSDRYECYKWAKTQSGFDPTQPPAGLSVSETATRNDQYKRAFTACLEGRGYSVRYGERPAPAPALPAPQPISARRSVPTVTEVGYHPLRVHIDGGYTVTTGATEHLLDGGANVGLGLTWFPSSILPIGLRVDGSYSSFEAKDALLNQYQANGTGFTSGHDNLYGGDADIQLDLAHGSAPFKFYLFGGAGWYRVQSHLRQVLLEQGTFCNFYFCEQGVGPVLTAVERSTTPWRSAWNAGLGWEMTYPTGASFFIEARYLRIAPHDAQLQFVPITIGLRF